MLNQEQTESLKELAAQQGQQVEQTEYGDMFVTHRQHRVFFKWHPEHDQWFFIIHRTGSEAATGYPTLGSEWFTSWSAWVQGIAWGQQKVDDDIAFWERHATRSQRN